MMVVSLMVIVSVACLRDGRAEAGDGGATVLVKVAPTLPHGAAAPVAGQLKGTASTNQGRHFLLKPVGGPAIAGQRDLATGKVWFVTAFTKDQLGTTLRYEATPARPEAILAITEEEGRFRFTEGRRTLLFYQRQPKSFEDKFARADYVHPLFGLDGETLTEDFPADHRHHRGVFWAWHQLWVGDLQIGDPWLASDFLADVRNVEIVDQGPVFATLKATVDWTSPLYTDAAGRPKPIIRQQTLIRAFRSTAGSQCLDFEISLVALVPDVRIGGAENERGYSGFTVRVKPPQGQKITDESGVLTEDRVGQLSRWADVSGDFDDDGRLAGVAILSHPSLPEFPPKWLLRHYGMQNVAYPGRHAVDVPRDRPLVIRHRLLLHRGDADQGQIAGHQTIYQTE